MDSHGSYLKLCVEHIANLYKIHILFVPQNMTITPQPLGVGVNRDFLQLYNGQYEEYIEEAMNSNNSPQFYTNGGHINIHSYQQVKEWCVSFSRSIGPGIISEAFDVCSINCTECQSIS